MSPNKNQAFRPDGRRRADGRFITDGAGALEESPPSARLFPPSGSTGAGSFLGVTFAFVFGKDLAFAFGSSASAVSAFFFGSALAFDFPVGSDFFFGNDFAFPFASAFGFLAGASPSGRSTAAGRLRTGASSSQASAFRMHVEL